MEIRWCIYIERVQSLSADGYGSDRLSLGSTFGETNAKDSRPYVDKLIGVGKAIRTSIFNIGFVTQNLNCFGNKLQTSMSYFTETQTT